MGPEQPGFGHTTKCRDVTATDSPSQYLRLQVFGRVQKYSIGTGLEPQMANEPFPERRMVSLERLQHAAQAIFDQYPRPTAGKP
jgi:hypothetical protein